MTALELQPIADAVIRRAREGGPVRPDDIQAELVRGGLDPELWPDVLELTRPSLRPRQGRYHYVERVSTPLRQEQNQQRQIQRVVKQMVRHYRRAACLTERRERLRVDFVQTVFAEMEDGRKLKLLSRDVSPTGIRLLGARSLLGHRVRLTLPREDGEAPWCFVVRVLWTCAVADGMFENGCVFLGIDSATALQEREAAG